MILRFPGKYVFTAEADLAAMIDEWSIVLSGLTQSDLENGLLASEEYLEGPNVNQFKSLCLFGTLNRSAEQKRQSAPTPGKIDRQCNYRHDNGVRCEREGTVSPDVRGGGSWFCCCDHGRALGHF